ncbi:MAG: hypothetical protein ACYCX5_04535 [Coriobacteriia bacterium]
MHPIWWFLIVIVLILLIAPWNGFRDDALGSRSRKLAMEQRLRRFEQEQRVRQQAAVMQRTRELNARALKTCRAMVLEALEAQREESEDADA